MSRPVPWTGPLALMLLAGCATDGPGKSSSPPASGPTDSAEPDGDGDGGGSGGTTTPEEPEPACKPALCSDGLFCNGVETCDTDADVCNPPAEDTDPDCIVDDLALRWAFDHPFAYALTEPDASGRSHDAALVWHRTRGGGGGELRPGDGVIGTGAAGVVSRGSIESAVGVELPEDWTLGLWLQRDTDSERFGRILGLRSEDGTNLGFVSAHGGGLTFNIVTETGTEAWGWSIGELWTPGLWSHFAFVFEGGAMSLFIDGERVELHGGPEPLALMTDGPVFLDLTELRGIPHHRFTGSVDDVRLYARALSDGHIAELADPESPAYTDVPDVSIADAGLGYTGWMDAGPVTLALDGTVEPSVEPSAEMACTWTVDQAPAGATVTFADPHDCGTEATFDTVGAHVLRLRVDDRGLRDEDTVNVAIFEDASPPPTTFRESDPSTTGWVDAIEPPRAEREVSGDMPLIAYWDFDEGAGDTAYAQGPEGQDLVVDRGEFTTDGRFGGALLLSPWGEDCEQLDFGAYPSLGEELSLSFWFQSDREDTRATFFYAQDDSENTGWAIQTQHNAHAPPWARFNVGRWGNTSWETREDWTHMVFTYDYATGVQKVYQDGILRVYSVDDLPLAVGEPHLRFSMDLNSYGYRGRLDDVALYDRTLNSDEVWALYQQPAGDVLERFPADPYSSVGFSEAMLDTYFPEPTPTFATEGFAEERFSAETPPAYEHPRLGLTRDHLPYVRQAARTRAGRRVLGEFRQFFEIGRQEQLDEDGVYPPDGGDNNLGAIIALDAFLALLDADEERASRCIDWLVGFAERRQPVSDAARTESNDWRSHLHDIVLRRGTALHYDWLYPWMTETERATVRRLLADNSGGSWSIGMGALPAPFANLSNWQNWITGELWMNQEAIFEEDGFDPETHAAAGQAVWYAGLIFGDAESGASREGMGKASLVPGTFQLYSQGQASGARLVSTEAVKHHVQRFTLHRLLPGGCVVWKDSKNGGYATMDPVPTRLALFNYPDDPLLNFLGHCANDSSDAYGDLQLTLFSQNPTIVSAAFLQDWSGPEDLQAHLEQAVAEAAEPPAYFSADRGLLISRSDWSADATQVFFQARANGFGHQLPDRGWFSLHAHGRTWVAYPGGKADSPQVHSIVNVDGDGPDYTPARMVAVSSAEDDPAAVVDLAVADLTLTYGHQGGGRFALNDFRIEPSDEAPWMDLPLQDLPDWYYGDNAPGLSPPAETGTFDYAYRAAALARGAHPYLFVADELAKDDDLRTYSWNVLMPDDIHAAGSYSISGDTVVWTDPDDPTRHLWIHVLADGTPDDFDVLERVHDGGAEYAEVVRLERPVVSTAGSFRAVLYPYRDGDPLPSVRTGAETVTVEVGGQTDVWTVRLPATGDLTVSMARDGTEVVSTE